MNWVTGIAMYFVLWWTALFAVLPIGTRPRAEADADSGWRGAPAKPMLWQKALGTTVLAAILWLIAYALITSPWLSFRTGVLALHPN